MTPDRIARAADSGARSQTLERGIVALIALSDAERPMTIQDLSDHLGLHRSIVYRILRTFEDYALVWRDQSGHLRLGARLAAIARSVSKDVQSVALPVLTELANTWRMTAFVSVWNGRECVTLVSVEPRRTPQSIALRAGARHPVGRGAPGVAIQACCTSSEWEAQEVEVSARPEVERLRRGGFIMTTGEIDASASALSVPLCLPGEPPAGLSLLYRADHVVSDVEAQAMGDSLRDAAAAIARDYVGLVEVEGGFDERMGATG
ncbi:helix-turn-helix domain-containing protein [Micrococcales bacterium 31B]|nr:helix-turn-helix domain-containing protein [Micrococcales bacterium 31B]